MQVPHPLLLPHPRRSRNENPLHSSPKDPTKSGYWSSMMTPMRSTYCRKPSIRRNSPSAAHEAQPQAILLDILMPGADGWQILHDLKEDQTTANIPVILLTIVDKKAL